MTDLQNEVHLWYVKDTDIQDTNLRQKYLTLLNDEEFRHYKRFRFPKHQHQYLVARALIRCVLSSYEPSISPRKWQFICNKFGKPFILNSDLSFNISHTDNYIFLAITAQKALGIDIEKITPAVRLLDIAHQHFTPEEKAILNSTPDNLQTKMFYLIWTLKEAYTKACGQGLSMPLNSFCVANKSLSVRLNLANINTHQNDWQFWQIYPEEDYVVSLAVKFANPLNNPPIFNLIPLEDRKEVKFFISKQLSL